MAKTANILSIHLAVGEDELKREEVLNRLRARLEQEGDLSFDLSEFNAETATGADVVAACETVPFMAPRRLVLVTHLEKMRKADTDLLVEYAKAPCESTVLALSAEKLAKSTRLYKAINALGDTAIIDCALPKGRDLQRNVVKMAAAHGVRLSDAGAALLIEYVGSDTVFLDNQLQKIALACMGEDVIGDDAVKEYVESTVEVKPWKFLEPFSERNLAASLQWLADAHGVSPHVLAPQCARRLYELVCAKTLDSQGRAAQLGQELGYSAAESWKTKNHVRYARKFSAEELREALKSLCDVEKAMKSGENPDLVFSRWVIDTLSR